MDEIRESLGVCPQTNVLFEQLTVREHLELYAALKGVKSNQVDKEIQRMIDDVGLTKKTNTQARSLSGGMKRKLCLANALLGDSAFVLIDEGKIEFHISLIFSWF
jgi:ATP-binding cassette, subfamily A (ABC1), member 3